MLTSLLFSLQALGHGKCLKCNQPVDGDTDQETCIQCSPQDYQAACLEEHTVDITGLISELQKTEQGYPLLISLTSGDTGDQFLENLQHFIFEHNLCFKGGIENLKTTIENYQKGIVWLKGLETKITQIDGVTLKRLDFMTPRTIHESIGILKAVNQNQQHKYKTSLYEEHKLVELLTLDTQSEVNTDPVMQKIYRTTKQNLNVYLFAYQKPTNMPVLSLALIPRSIKTSTYYLYILGQTGFFYVNTDSVKDALNIIFSELTELNPSSTTFPIGIFKAENQ